MNKPTQEEIMKKWTTALGSIKETKSEEFSSLLPIAMKVAAKTIAMDLCFASKEEIDAIIEDGEFTEKKLEDDEEYKKLMKKGVSPMSAPSSTLFYLDYKYGDEPHKKTRRSKKKKNGNI